MQLVDVTRKAEAKRFWPSEGAYLHKSTLKNLARGVSGCDLPNDLIEDNTFEISINPARDSQAGMVRVVDLHDSQPATVGPDQRNVLMFERYCLRVSSDVHSWHDGKNSS